MRKWFVSFLMVVLLSLIGISANAEPDYRAKAVERYQVLFAKPETIANWQSTLDQVFPGVKIQKIDFKFEIGFVAENDEHTVCIVGRLLVQLRSIKDDKRITVLVDRVVILLADNKSGEILNGTIYSQEDAKIINGWNGVDI
jgi:hypothetical protein